MLPDFTEGSRTIGNYYLTIGNNQIIISSTVVNTFSEFRLINCLPSKRLLVWKTSSPRLQRNNFTSSKTSWRHLVRRLGRRKIVTLKTSWRHLENMSWRRLADMSWRRLEDMSWRCLEDISWRRLEDTMERNKILTGDLTNLYAYLTNLYFTNLYPTILRRIQNALISIK